MDAEVGAALAAIEKKLDRLELIESHLLDLLLPQRKAYTRSPVPEPPAVVAESVQQLLGHTVALHEKLDALSVQVAAAAPNPPATATWEQAALEVKESSAPAPEVPPSA